ncbi:hypothetical protein HHI36_005280 [Cryptolaemus montrouzieri]|uniref:BED-type domain-containing protein n=1 Tax=Cryptolaemus montrouzieri TaxID=559131 RepID=A0ABD2NTM9_9CUCU
MASSPKKSAVWTCFTVNEKSAKCSLCQANVSRGGMERKTGTLSLKKHLQFKHKVEYEQLYSSLSRTPSQSESGSDLNTSQNSQIRHDTKQLSLEEVVEKEKLWDINDARTKRYHYLIDEMIAYFDGRKSFGVSAFNY